MTFTADPDNESMEGHCPQELGIIRLDVWRVDSVVIVYHKSNNRDSISVDLDSDSDSDNSDPEIFQAIHERDAKAKGTEYRIKCVLSPRVEAAEAKRKLT